MFLYIIFSGGFCDSGHTQGAAGDIAADTGTIQKVTTFLVDFSC